MYQIKKSPVLQCLEEAERYYSRSEIADKLGVSPSTVTRWSKGDTDPKPYVVDSLRQLLMPFGDAGQVGDFTFIDLFAGIGGIRKAFELQGGSCVFTSEWDAYARRTYHANFIESHQTAGDITQVDTSKIPEHDVLLAGFPCQPFSIAGVSKKNALGRAHGFEDKTQGTLFFDVARIIQTKRPKAFLLENVKNLQSHDKGRTFRVILETLQNELGYHIQWTTIDGQHWTPQHRERTVIVGFSEPVGFSFDALQLPEKGAVKMKHILHKTDDSEPFIEDDESRFFDHVQQQVLEKYTLSDKLWLYLQNYAAKHRAKGNGFGFGLVYPDSVSRTLSARYYKDGSEILVWQGEDINPRRLTPRECARLMGYPDDFRIPVSDTRAYQLFAKSAVLPMMNSVAEMMKQFIVSSDKVTKLVTFPTGEKTMKSRLWTREQVLVALNLYCQMPFGKMHKGNPDIIQVAKLIGRTPDALAMKLTNLASLDPQITESGRKGLSACSKLDKEVWTDFQENPEEVGYESQSIVDQLARQEKDIGKLSSDSDSDALIPDYFSEYKAATVQVRVKQSFFRKSVLSSYENRCCMTGISDSRLLVASHIVPWKDDENNRLNPRNGLCLSALHDKAYDRGLLSVTPDFIIKVSSQLDECADSPLARDYLLNMDGNTITLPKKFIPSRDLLAHHYSEIFRL